MAALNPESEIVTRRLLFHVHTRRSFDSLLSPRRIVVFARQHHFDAVIVTDHGTHLGAADVARAAGDAGPLFPLAAEYKSTSGDMIAVFITQPVMSRDPLGIIEETHAQGGLVILPHPLRYSHFADEVFERCDLIETFNARTPDADNARAAQIAAALNKPTIAGPDAHIGCEMALVTSEYDVPTDWDWKRILLNAQPRVTAQKSAWRNIRLSQLYKGCRRVRPVLVAKSLIRLITTPADRRI
ncbi:MAG TPA: PHP domain-containing protein [Acidobacteriota bacterium]|nr:PHP domain-containing protein [Acidobacteriota bacterium]